MARISGTTQRPPVDGPLAPTSTGAGGGAVTIESNSVNVSGQAYFASTGNVGTSFNPSGESLLSEDIDQIKTNVTLEDAAIEDILTTNSDMEVLMTE